jgi:uncharacterized protein (TIGR04255 family)
MPDQLPAFDRPPLDEMAMGIQFLPIRDFVTPHLGLYWSKIRERYPRAEDQLPLPHGSEPLAIQPPQNPAASVTFFQKPRPLRCWFLDSTGNQLIQVQNDRFLRNWRQIVGNEAYPRFHSLFQSFWKEWSGFQAFLQDEELQIGAVDLCELTYINHIIPDGGWSDFSEMTKIFTVLRGLEPGHFLPAPDLLGWQASFPLPNNRGRLRIEANPSFRARDLKLMVVFNLTVRGDPGGSSEDAIKGWFNLAHEWAVRAFDELTSSLMHQAWGKRL